MARCYIGLGSNLAGPADQIRRALRSLAELEQTHLVACSSLYRSAPMGPQDQPDYLNAVAELDSGLPPLELLDALQAIEAAQGRDRSGVRWGARTLDLDILLYGDRRIQEPRLTVPHVGMAERGFVLYPLAELNPGLEIPGHGPLRALLERCPPNGLEKLRAVTDSEAYP